MDQTQSSPSLPGKTATISSIVSIKEKMLFVLFVSLYQIVVILIVI